MTSLKTPIAAYSNSLDLPVQFLALHTAKKHAVLNQHASLDFFSNEALESLHQFPPNAPSTALWIGLQSDRNIIVAGQPQPSL